MSTGPVSNLLPVFTQSMEVHMEKEKRGVRGALAAICFFVLLTAVGIGTAGAASYYVSSAGSDSSNGSINAPFATIQHAANIVNPGDTVYVRGGTYYQRVSLTRSGSSAGYITFQNYPGESPVLDGRGFGAGYMFAATDVSYLKIIGLTVQNYTGGGIFVQTSAGKASHIEIRDNTVQNQTCDSTQTYLNDAISINAWPWQSSNSITDIVIDGNSLSNINNVCANEALTISGEIHRFQITNNTLDAVTDIGIDVIGQNENGYYGRAGEFPTDGIISGNEIKNSQTDSAQYAAAIYLDGAQNVTIEKNIVHDNSDIGIDPSTEQSGFTTQNIIIRNNVLLNNGRGIDFGASWNGTDEGVRIAHNTVAVTATGKQSCFSMGKGTDIVGKNNIAYFGSTGTFYPIETLNIVTGTDTQILDYNLYYPASQSNMAYWYGTNSGGFYSSLSAYQAGTGQDAHAKGQNPMFVDLTNDNFALQSGSPAIDAGGFLTSTTSAGSGTTIPVADAKYFNNGYGISGVAGDTIMVGSNTATVTGVDYDTNTLTVDRSISWNSGDGVSYPYAGSRPDMGAFEYGTTSATTSPAPAPTPTPAPADTLPPSPPAGLTAAAVSSSQINLSWTSSTDNVGVAGYKVYRNGTQIATSATATYADTGLLSSTSYTYGVVAYDAAGNTSSSSSLVSLTTPSVTTTSGSNTYISDLSWVGTPVNGWGPVEKDTSNGESAAGDGGTITLNGVTYAKGLGVHANSQVTYNLGGSYSRFVSDIGVDDEVGSAGSVVFQVWADGIKIYDSGLMTGSSATRTVNVAVTGVNQLQLVVTDGGDNNNSDHADWAGAYLAAGATSPAPAPAPAPATTYISDLSWVGTPVNGWGPVEKDTSNGESAAGDGGTITLNGVTYAKGLGVHANSQVTYNLGGSYSRFVSDIGVDDEVGSAGSVVFQVWADGIKIYDSGLMTGSSATRTVNVAVTGVNQLQLVVTDGGDNNNNDHADWAGAYLAGSN
jgi:chitodextrinase